jgi:Na+-translocating ferredoxin:NAD+ oxidoreductase RnfG subunit
MALAENGASIVARFGVMLQQHFNNSREIRFTSYSPGPQAAARIHSALGEPLKGRRYAFWTARSGDTVNGYAHLGKESSLYGTFRFGVFFDADRRVSKVSIVEYSEDRGSEIRSRRFLKQFVGRGADSGFEPRRDVDMITGATVSSSALCRGVQRATLLLEELHR